MINQSEQKESPGSLGGLRVLDLTTNVAGPYATQVLGDLGADVIKVERPTGDDTRGWGPPFWDQSGESVTFSTLNRNKRSVVLDLRSEGGKEALTLLIAKSDVLIQNMRPGSLDRLGFSWEELQKINPSLIYCEMSGFGHVGPRANQPAYDPLMQAFSGLMSLTGEEGRSPVRIPVSILDKGTGMWAVIAILDALRTRDHSGVGAHLQLSLLETALAWEAGQVTGYISSGKVPKRLGSATAGIAPYQAFPTSDGHIVVAAGNQRLWKRLCEAIDRLDLLADERYLNNTKRFQNLEPLVEALSAMFSRSSTQEWIERLETAGVPVAPIQTTDQVVQNKQVLATGAIEKFCHPDDGQPYALVRLPVNVNGERHPIRQLPPRLGQHSEEIMAEIGLVESVDQDVRNGKPGAYKEG